MKDLIKNIYLYLVSLITLIILIFTIFGFVNSIVNILNNVSYDYPESYIFLKERYVYEVLNQSPENYDEEINIKDLKEFENEMLEKRKDNDFKRNINNLIENILLIIIVFPIYYYHWRKTKTKQV